VLQLYSSLIVGFTTPLKEEHKEIYRKCLVHLHKSQYLESFHYYLLECVLVYFEKDKSEV
jgi:hypothetical protein